MSEAFLTDKFDLISYSGQAFDNHHLCCFLEKQLVCAKLNSHASISSIPVVSYVSHAETDFVEFPDPTFNMIMSNKCFILLQRNSP